MKTALVEVVYDDDGPRAAGACCSGPMRRADVVEVVTDNKLAAETMAKDKILRSPYVDVRSVRFLRFVEAPIVQGNRARSSEGRDSGSNPDRGTDNEIRTVGDLRNALSCAEDEEPLIFDLEESTIFGKRRSTLKCVGVGSSGGGRITVLWLDKKYPEQANQ